MSYIASLVLVVGFILVSSGIIYGLLRWTNRRTAPQNPAAPSSEEDKATIIEDEGHIKSYAWLYYFIVIAFFAIWLGGGWYLSGISSIVVGGVFNLGYFILGLGLLYFIASIDIIKRNEMSGVSILGWPTKVFSGSLAIVLPGIMEQDEVTALVVELAWPEDDTKVWRGPPDLPVPPGMFPPIRIPFADETGADATADPLTGRVTEEATLFVRIRVCYFWDFFSRIGDTDKNISASEEYQEHPERMLTNAREQIGNMAISLIFREFSNKSLARSLAEVDTVNGELLSDIKRKTKWWGIDVVDAKVKLFVFSKSLNTSIESAVQAKFAARATVTAAEAEKIRLTRAGEGNAAAEKAMIIGRGEGEKEAADKLGVRPQDQLAAEVLRDIAQAKPTIIMPGFDLTNLVGTFAKNFKGTQPTSGENP